MMRTRKNLSCSRLALFAGGGLLGLCLLLAGVSALVNRAVPQQLLVTDRLSAVDQARLQEGRRLREQLGGQVLPGWDAADLPMIVYNEQYAFLVGLHNPPPGWTTIPAGQLIERPWEPVPAGASVGEPPIGGGYYRLRLPENKSPQNFAVLVGEQPVSSMMQMEYFRVALAQQLRADLPAPLQPIFPYPLVTRLFMPGSDRWETALLHEQAHAYQYQRDAARLMEAERAGFEQAKRYPWEADDFRAAWQAELDILAQGARAQTREDALAAAEQFLANRAARRRAAGLAPELAQYERQREWVEGIAKYVEWRVYRAAYEAAREEPSTAVAGDPEFHNYQNYPRHWNNEVDQIRRMAGDHGDGRFYYSGMGQALLLDLLDPTWKDRLFDDGVWLEDLLQAAVKDFE
jgi:hypothetical protein